MTSTREIIQKRSEIAKKKAELEKMLKKAEMRVEKIKSELSKKAARLERFGLPPRALARMEKLSGAILHHLIAVRGWEWFEQNYLGEGMAALEAQDRSFYEETLRGMYAAVELTPSSVGQLPLLSIWDEDRASKAGLEEESLIFGPDTDEEPKAEKGAFRKAG